MKKTSTLIITFVILAFFAALSARAVVLFQDALNYPNGCIETDGLWFASAPAVPHLDAFIADDLLILNSTNYDTVAAPSNNFTNTPGNTIVFASFTINVSSLPTTDGGYFAYFKDTTNDYICHVFIDTTNTVVPGTYRLGIANTNNDIYLAGSASFPLDLATGITYQVVFSYDVNTSDPYPNATLWVNPVTINDYNVYGTDLVTATNQVNIVISQVAFSQYPNQGVAAIGNVIVGTTFGDVQANTPQIPVIGIEPQSTTLYSGNNLTLYTAASGLGQLTYQWLSNNVPLSDGTYVSGSLANVLTLTDLQNTANYSVAVANSAGSVTSAPAMVTVITEATRPFFTLQPLGETNSVLSPITLTAAANGTGPITYQWFFEPVGGNTFSAAPGASSSSSYSFTAAYANSGSYYVTATGGAGSQNSVTVNVLVIQPPVVSIGYMHQFIQNVNGNVPINGGQIFNVEGVVTTIGQIESKTSSEFFIQDGTGGCLVYAGGFNVTNTPPVGALVNVISPAESYYGELEMDPTTGAATNAVIILSTNNPLPAPIPLNIAAVATGVQNCSIQGTYGCSNQCSLVTLTNVYLYSTAAGAAVSGNFPTNSTKGLYAFQQPYSAGAPYVEVYVYTYTNVLNQVNTNYWGKPIPGFCTEITAALGVYAPTQPEPYPSRYADFVTNKPAAFTAGISNINGVSQMSWPAGAAGSTYSVYSATNLLGPWTQTFGLGYYPNTGIYAATNAAATQFYQISTP